ncbi:hypothetical protein ABPG75_007632 [Micractinium tetrahymenae]
MRSGSGLGPPSHTQHTGVIQHHPSQGKDRSLLPMARATSAARSQPELSLENSTLGLQAPPGSIRHRLAEKKKLQRCPVPACLMRASSAAGSWSANTVANMPAPSP